MEKTEELVSVFVPYYNDSEFLSSCIDSILGQTYDRFELILLNHASTDGSDRIAESYSDPRIKHISLRKNLGAGGGLLVQEFLNIAQGAYIKLFCADDVMHSDCLESFVAYMHDNPDIDVVFGNIHYIDHDSKSLHNDWFQNRTGFSLGDSSVDMLRKYKKGISFLPYIGSFARREAFKNLHLNKTFILLFDMTLWIEMLLNNMRFGFLDKIIAFYRIHRNQISSISSIRISSERSFFESSAYCTLFYSCVKDIDTLKSIFNDSPFADQLNDGDTDFIEFIIAHYYLRGFNTAYRINAYLRLERIFEDSLLGKRVEERFSYGIREFREDYSEQSGSTRKKLYTKDLRELSYTNIIHIFFSKLWGGVGKKSIKKVSGTIHKKNKRYSI